MSWMQFLIYISSTCFYRSLPNIRFLLFRYMNLFQYWRYGRGFYCLSLFLLLLCLVGEAFLWLPLFPDGFFGELWVRENSRNSSFKFVLRSFCVIEAICLSSWQALIACENKRVLEAVGSIGRVDSLVEDVVLSVLAWWASFDEFVANLSNVSFKTPLLWVNLDISFSLSDLNLWFSSTSKLTGAGMSRTI